jgi:hypothetical protein
MGMMKEGGNGHGALKLRNGVLSSSNASAFFPSLPTMRGLFGLFDFHSVYNTVAMLLPLAVARAREGHHHMSGTHSA